MRPELTLFNMKVAYLTADQLVKIRIALNNHELALQRLLDMDKSWEPIYRTELMQLKEAKQSLLDSYTKD